MRAPGGSTFYQAPGCVRCFLDGGSVCLVNINGSTVTARIQAGDGPVSSFDYHAKCALLASCASTETTNSKPPNAPTPLSKRETQIFDLLIEGKPNKEIAKKLHISSRTVEYHRSNIMKKLHARNVVNLILGTQGR
jgi:DNA-binding NarL/FixJ family response regulator